MILLYDDLVKTGSLTPSSEVSGYPAVNTQHPHLSRKWRTDTDSGEYVVVDFGAAVTVDAAAMAGHNLTDAGVARIEANSSDSWAAPPFSRSLDPARDPSFVTFPQQSYQFWRFYFDDGSNPDTYIAVGRLFLCVHWASVEPIDAAFNRTLEDTTRITESITGQAFVDLGVKSRTISLSLGFVSDADRQTLEAAISVIGQHDPVIVHAHDKVEPLYARLVKLPTFSQVGALNWRDGTLQFKEAF